MGVPWPFHEEPDVRVTSNGPFGQYLAPTVEHPIPNGSTYHAHPQQAGVVQIVLRVKGLRVLLRKGVGDLLPVGRERLLGQRA
jgi:hypothetical protein